MAVWVALLRAVNVGGRNGLPMAELRAALEAAGLESVRTYIQSGNVVFRAEKTAGAVSTLIADVIEKGWGLRPPVLVLSGPDLAAALSGNPFAAAPPDKVHVFFAERDLPRATADFLKSVAAPGETYQFRGRTLWLHLPDGVARSKLAHRVMALPLDITTRNMKTVASIASLVAKETK